MIPVGHHLWRLSAGGDQNLGLCCSEDGLFLGRTPLIERCSGTYVVRPKAELERLLGRAYGGEAAAAQVIPGLATVAAALSGRNLALAQIAAVHLRLPDLPDALAQALLEAEDLLIKRGSAAWDESYRAGTPQRKTCSTISGSEEVNIAPSQI